MSTFDEIREAITAITAEIERYKPTLCCGELVEIAKQQGWAEIPSQGKGSHRCLKQEGYAPITLKCHGEGDELDRSVTRERLREIYQPAIDAILSSTLEGAIAAKIDQLDAVLAHDLKTLKAQVRLDLQSLQAAAYDALSQLEDQASETLERLEQQAEIAIEQRTNQRLHEIDRSAEELLDEQQKAFVAQKQREVQRLRQQMSQTEASLSRLEAAVRTKSQQLDHLQQQLNDRAEELDQQKIQLRQAQQHLSSLQSELQQERTRFVRYRRQQRWKDVFGLASFGIACILAFALFRPVPLIADALTDMLAPIPQDASP